MSKPRRRRPPKPATNGKAEPTAIDQAIASAEERNAPMKSTLFVSRKPIVLGAKGSIKIQQGDSATEAQMLVRGADGLWHGVLMPPGSMFELRASGPGAAIWTPPGSVK